MQVIAGCTNTNSESSGGILAAGNGVRGKLAVVPSTENVDFGIVPQRTRHLRYVELWNPSDKSVEVDAMVASCDCLEVVVPTNRIEPGARVLACVRLDLTLAPQFLGSLEMEAHGRSTNGEPCVSIKVNVEVRETEAFADFQSDPWRNGEAPIILTPTPMGRSSQR